MNSQNHLEIETTLLRIVSHHNSPKIIFAVIDTSVDASGGIAPFLNIYGYRTSDEVNLDKVIGVAIENDDFGFITDELKVVDENAFEINISFFYPSWPDDLETGTEKISSAIQSTISKNAGKFENVEKLYLHFVDSFDFVKIIDLPSRA